MTQDGTEHSTDSTDGATIDEAAMERQFTASSIEQGPAATSSHDPDHPAPVTDPDEGAHNYGMSDAEAASNQWFDDASRYE
jgi:hypothetical protein